MQQRYEISAWRDYQLYSSPLILHSFSHMFAIGRLASKNFRIGCNAFKCSLMKGDDLNPKTLLLLLALCEMM